MFGLLWIDRMDNTWSIGINQWILADGNYASFQVGETRQFALEFYSKDFAHSESPVKTAELIDHYLYRVNAVVDYIDEDMWVLDFGIKAYGGRPGPVEDFVSTLSVGQAVKCTLNLGIDYYIYMERLCLKPGVVPLIYTWHIDAINKQAGPRVKADGMWIVDEAEAQWHKVESTSAALPKHTGSNELCCTLVDPVPTADGEPLATWDQPEMERAFKTMGIDDLHSAIELIDVAIEKLEKFVAAAKPPEDPTAIIVISRNIWFSRFLRGLATMLNLLNLKHPNQSKLEVLYKELNMKETLERLSTEPKWILQDPRLAEDYLFGFVGLREKALKRLTEVENNNPI